MGSNMKRREFVYAGQGIFIAIFIGLIPLLPSRAWGEDLVGSTSCTDYLRMEAEDTQPGADHAIALKHVTSLMHEYSIYILRGADGRPIPTIFNFLVSYSTHYCQSHPSATIAEAGNAIGEVEKNALANAKQR
jgi:hypothetical protein